MEEIYLQHHGILGMKWGIRRYQNADGTLTEAGKARLEKEKLRNRQKSKKNRVAEEDLLDPDRWVNEDITSTRDITNASRQMANDLKTLEEKTRSKKEPERLDLSKMSDKELRDQINRELLERQYNSIFNAKEVSNGREWVHDILDIGAAGLGVVSSALAIALAIRQLRGS